MKITNQITGAAMKKHAIQMTQAEKDFLAAKVAAVSSWGFTYHAQEKMAERKARQAEVLAAIQRFTVIEANFGGGKKVLVRGLGVVGGRQVCAVLAPERRTVVTVYFNAANDQHMTLNMAAYRRNLDVCAEWNK